MSATGPRVAFARSRHTGQRTPALAFPCAVLHREWLHDEPVPCLAPKSDSPGSLTRRGILGFGLLREYSMAQILAISPCGRATKPYLVVNLNTANALGLKPPHSALLPADETVQ